MAVTIREHVDRVRDCGNNNGTASVSTFIPHQLLSAAAAAAALTRSFVSVISRLTNASPLTPC